MYESKIKIGLVTERRWLADAATRKGIFQPLYAVENKDHIVKFIKENNLSIGRIINCTPSDVGATNFSIEDGTHATALANSVYNAIGRRSTVERRATLHIFAAAPNAFMFFLGQNSVGFGKCILYEYDFEQRNSCTYSQSISFTN